MKQFITSLIIVICIFCPVAQASNVEDMTIYLTEQEVDGDYHEDLKTKGPRSIPNMAICTISFNSASISTTISSEIVSYEILDAEGEAILYSSSDERDTVEFMSTIVGNYRLRILTSTRSYVGCISL